MNSASEFRQRAERYRRMRWQTTDPTAVRAICEEADKLEVTAEEVERRHQIRKRAHEIWTERGRPLGRDVKFWLAAEREVEIQRRR
jgi:hypothetical protein